MKANIVGTSVCLGIYNKRAPLAQAELTIVDRVRSVNSFSASLRIKTTVLKQYNTKRNEVKSLTDGVVRGRFRPSSYYGGNTFYINSAPVCGMYKQETNKVDKVAWYADEHAKPRSVFCSINPNWILSYKLWGKQAALLCLHILDLSCCK